MSLPPALLEQIYELAKELPAQAGQPLIHVIAACSAEHWAEIKRQAQGAIAHSYYRERVGNFVDLWRTLAPELEPKSLALALETAVYCMETARHEQTLELVWTGPQSDTSFRRTDQALLQLIESARSELIIVSFAVYNIPGIKAALIRAAERSVHLCIIIESAKESTGKITYDGLVALGPRVATRADIYRWPIDKRGKSQDGKSGTLHVKCAVADGRMLLISSANLTEYALTLNMEMGVLITGGQLPKQVSDHFVGMIEDRTLVKIAAS
jgi:phosphatidylserine/phosphatidylglycerophosphate/cardiolipin synthase-like enzyme